MKINKDKVTEFIAGVIYVAIIAGCTVAILLKMGG